MLNDKLTSSTGSGDISATVTGVLMGCSGLILYAMRYFWGINLPGNDFALIAAQIGTAAGTFWTLFGLLRKVLVKTTSTRNVSAKPAPTV